MIPKVIHYCWFGNNKKPDLIEKCIESWKKYCPDYEIKEWNEDNFDINSLSYVKQAYMDKKYAFVSDYVRLYAVYTCGGIYLDTDVLLHNRIDELLNYNCWLASDDVRYIATGLGFGAEKNNKLIKEIMDPYNHYDYPGGTNVTRDTKVLEKELKEWKKSDRNQVINYCKESVLIIGLNDYGKYAKHLYTYTWADEETQKKRIADIKNESKKSFKSRFIWKIKLKMRNPKIISYFDQRRGSKLEKIYAQFKKIVALSNLIQRIYHNDIRNMLP